MMKKIYTAILLAAISFAGFAQDVSYPAGTKPASTNIVGADYQELTRWGRFIFA